MSTKTGLENGHFLSTVGIRVQGAVTNAHKNSGFSAGSQFRFWPITSFRAFLRPIGSVDILVLSTDG